jgi:hypothetical protein
MALSVDDIKAKFPTKTLPVVVGEPTYENIRVLTEALYGNAASLHVSMPTPEEARIIV